MTKERDKYLQNLIEATSKVSNLDRDVSIPKHVDSMGPMIDPILSYRGSGELETSRNAADILERFYRSEDERDSLFESEDSEIDEVPDENIEKTKKQIEKELTANNANEVEESVLDFFLKEMNDEDEDEDEDEEDELDVDKELNEGDLSGSPTKMSPNPEDDEEDEDEDLEEAYQMFLEELDESALEEDLEEDTEIIEEDFILEDGEDSEFLEEFDESTSEEEKLLEDFLNEDDAELLEN